MSTSRRSCSMTSARSTSAASSSRPSSAALITKAWSTLPGPAGRWPSARPAITGRSRSLTAQDIAVFFQEGLAALPDLAADLAGGGRVLDVHCGGGRWLIAVATRFPETSLVGVELEPDSLARAVPPRPGGRPVEPDRDRGPARRGPALAGPRSTWSTSRTRSTMCRIRSPRSGRRGPASAPAGGSSSSTGRCPRPATNRARSTAR